MRDLNFNECLIFNENKMEKIAQKKRPDWADYKNIAGTFVLFLTHKPIKWTFEGGGRVGGGNCPNDIMINKFSSLFY